MAFTNIFRRTPWLRQAWKPLTFPKTNFECIPLIGIFEEEFIPHSNISDYYPAQVGEVLRDRYQLVGKMGSGRSLIFWQARDLRDRRHVALKLYKNSKTEDLQLENELEAYKRISEASSEHPGRETVRELIDSFDITGPKGTHHCMLHLPLWESLGSVVYRTRDVRLTAPLLAFVLRRLFLALDFLRTECKVIHTNINSVNIIFATADDTIFSTFEEQALDIPCPRKIVDGRAIYQSRQLKVPTSIGLPMLCDFGSAEFGDKERPEDPQPQIYRSPETILEAPWSYEIDIWNVGCVIWDLFEGRGLFTGQDPELHTYRNRAHLAEIIALLGPPPQSLLQSGKISHKHFTETGEFRNAVPIPKRTTLEEQETNLDGEDQQMFLAVMRKMLQWDPSKRASAKKLAEDDWILNNVGDKEAREWRIIDDS